MFLCSIIGEGSEPGTMSHVGADYLNFGAEPQCNFRFSALFLSRSICKFRNFTNRTARILVQMQSDTTPRDEAGGRGSRSELEASSALAKNIFTCGVTFPWLMAVRERDVKRVACSKLSAVIVMAVHVIRLIFSLLRRNVLCFQAR